MMAVGSRLQGSQADQRSWMRRTTDWNNRRGMVSHHTSIEQHHPLSHHAISQLCNDRLSLYVYMCFIRKSYDKSDDIRIDATEKAHATSSIDREPERA